MILIIRTPTGSIQELSLHPPLRLLVTNTPTLSQLPPEVVSRIVSFLEPNSEDWLAADSICPTWRSACLSHIWNNSIEQRHHIADLCWTRRRMQRKWRKLQGFLLRTNQLNGPASPSDLETLQKLLHPWKLPNALLASLQIHNGERESLLMGSAAPGSLYPGARLLSALEIASQLGQFQCATTTPCYNPSVLTIPLFTEAASRLVGMELWLPDDGQNFPNPTKHGKVVLLNALAPLSTPPYRVLAESWEGFLTLI